MSNKPRSLENVCTLGDLFLRQSNDPTRTQKQKNTDEKLKAILERPMIDAINQRKAEREQAEKIREEKRQTRNAQKERFLIQVQKRINQYLEPFDNNGNVPKWALGETAFYKIDSPVQAVPHLELMTDAQLNNLAKQI